MKPIAVPLAPHHGLFNTYCLLATRATVGRGTSITFKFRQAYGWDRGADCPQGLITRTQLSYAGRLLLSISDGSNQGPRGQPSKVLLTTHYFSPLSNRQLCLYYSPILVIGALFRGTIAYLLILLAQRETQA